MMARRLWRILSRPRAADAPARRAEDQYACDPRGQERIMLRTPRFIEPCLPTLRKEPLTELGWIHKVKFDGFRVQIHRDGAQDITIYSRNGDDLTKRYPNIVRTLFKMPTQQFIIDGELCATDGQGNPDFGALLMGLADEVCVWVFDILGNAARTTALCRTSPATTSSIASSVALAAHSSATLRPSPNRTLSCAHALSAASKASSRSASTACIAAAARPTG
jgi:hypothetical protein